MNEYKLPQKSQLNWINLLQKVEFKFIDQSGVNIFVPNPQVAKIKIKTWFSMQFRDK